MSVRDLVAAMSRREQVAWLALALLVPAAGYVGWWLFFDPSGQTGGVPRTVRHVGSGACLVFVLARMWIVQRGRGVPRKKGSGVGSMGKGGRGGVTEERGRQISARAVASGYAWLAWAVFGTSAIVGLDSWQGYLASRSPAWVESFLLFCLLSSFVVIAMVQAAHYWRDRR